MTWDRTFITFALELYEFDLTKNNNSRLVANIAGHLSNAASFIQQRAVENFTKCDPDYGKRLADALRKLSAANNNTNVSYNSLLLSGAFKK